MKRLITLAVALALSTTAFAQLYKYVDKDGKTVYTDQPPSSVDPKQLKVQTGTGSAPEKTAVQRDKDLQKGRDETAKKSEVASAKAKENELRCANARAEYDYYIAGGRMFKMEKGERIPLGDAEIETERDRTRRAMEEACKSA
jgi:hypothetical protein